MTVQRAYRKGSSWKPEKPSKDDALAAKIIKLINVESRESVSDTPDYILGRYLLDCLKAHESAVRARDAIWEDEG